jgi:hypothetical protein
LAFLVQIAQAQYVKSNSITVEKDKEEITTGTSTIFYILGIATSMIALLFIQYRISFKELMAKRLPGAEEKLMYALISIRNFD